MITDIDAGLREALHRPSQPEPWSSRTGVRLLPFPQAWALQR